MTFKAGHDKTGGRVAGTPNKVTLEGRQIALGFAAEAMQTAVDIMRDADAPHTTRLAAAIDIMNRAWGRPTQAIEQVGETKPLEVMIRHFSDAAPVEPEDDQPRLL